MFAQRLDGLHAGLRVAEVVVRQHEVGRHAACAAELDGALNVGRSDDLGAVLLQPQLGGAARIAVVLDEHDAAIAQTLARGHAARRRRCGLPCRKRQPRAGAFASLRAQIDRAMQQQGHLRAIGQPEADAIGLDLAR